MANLSNNNPGRAAIELLDEIMASAGKAREALTKPAAGDITPDMLPVGLRLRFLNILIENLILLKQYQGGSYELLLSKVNLEFCKVPISIMGFSRNLQECLVDLFRAIQVNSAPTTIEIARSLIDLDKLLDEYKRLEETQRGA